MQLPTALAWFNNLLLDLSPAFLMMVIKTTFILMCALITLKIVPKLSAAIRYRVIVIAITGTLVLPLLSMILPEWGVIPDLGGSSGIVSIADYMGSEADPGILPSTLESLTVIDNPANLTDVTGTIIEGNAQATSGNLAQFKFSWLNLLTLLTVTWLIGILFGIIRISRGIIMTRRLVAEATPITDPNWQALLLDCRRELGLTRSVAILSHDSPIMPTAWGLSRPAIILPKEADSWTDSHKRLVLLHEISHILRLDSGFQLLSLLSCTLHWYNPLVWKSYRKLKAERERACDDMVLRAGAEAQSYAEMLLRSVAIFKPFPNVTPGMARSTELESRLLAIIDTGRNRNSSKGKNMTSILLTLAVLAPIAAAELAEPIAQPDMAIIESGHEEAPEALVANSILADKIERSFKVKYGDKLVLNVGGGSVDIRTSKTKKVEILIESRGGTLEESDFEIKQEKGVVYVTMISDWGYDNRRRNSRDRRRNFRINYTINVPVQFNLDVVASGGRTEIGDIKGNIIVENSGGGLTLGEVDGNLEAINSGGSLKMGSITGSGNLRSSGGSLRFGDVGGAITARSSGGSLRMGNSGGPADLQNSGGGIEAGNIEGSLDAHTSGGGITIGNVKGYAELKTSGGSIRAEIVTGEVTASTSGGSVLIEEVGGAFNASTSGGRIEAYITKQPQRACNLKTSGGGVVLFLKDNIKFSLDMDVDRPDIVSTNFATKKAIAKDATSWDGDINGGGPRIRIRTRGNRYEEANIFVLKASGR